MTNQGYHILQAAPEIWILGTVCVALLVDLFATFKYRVYAVSQVGLLAVLITTILHFPINQAIAFHGLLMNDNLGMLLQGFIALLAMLAFFYSRYYLSASGLPEGEYYVLSLLSVLGMMVIVSGHSLLTLYLGLELMSLPLYALVALMRQSEVGSEAALKYFVTGAIASGMLLYGMSMLYGATGHLDLEAIAQAVTTISSQHHIMLEFALIFIVAGIGFKLAAVPFHMWLPDVYSGAPASVTLFLSGAPKLAAGALAFRLLLLALPGAHWQSILEVLAVLSLVLGNVVALAQSNVRRMLAYSAIGHMGYMLLGFFVASAMAYSAALFYLIVYGITAVAGFALIVLLSQKGFEIQAVDDLKGLNRSHPLLAGMMLIVLLSMAGVPPTVGFFAKWWIIKALIDAHDVGLAVFALLFAVVGAAYYLRIIKVMYFDEVPKENAGKKLANVPMSMQWMFVIHGLALLALGLFPGILMNACRLAF